jgi:hypothetical protein
MYFIRLSRSFGDKTALYNRLAWFDNAGKDSILYEIMEIKNYWLEKRSGMHTCASHG